MNTRALLLDQRNSLVAATSPLSQPYAIERARRMIARIDARLLDTDAGLHACRGLCGPNGWAPQVESIVCDLEFRPSPVAVADERKAA